MQHVAGGLEFSIKDLFGFHPLSPRVIGDFIRRRVRHLPRVPLTNGESYEHS
jgi:hypothetical protein